MRTFLARSRDETSYLLIGTELHCILATAVLVHGIVDCGFDFKIKRGRGEIPEVQAEPLRPIHEVSSISSRQKRHEIFGLTTGDQLRPMGGFAAPFFLTD
jgi:hypothetical protein